MGVDRGGNRRSPAILARIFPGEEARQQKAAAGARSGGPHSFLAERGSERPGAVKGAPWARAQRPLTARTALREFPQEGMGPLLVHHDFRS